MRSEGFETWYRREHPRVLAACLALAPDADLARESTDEALTVALERWPSVQEMRCPGGWVQTVGLNKMRRAFASTPTRAASAGWPCGEERTGRTCR